MSSEFLKSIMSDESFLGILSNKKNEVTSNDILLNFAKRVDNHTLINNDKDILEYYVENYNFNKDEPIESQTNRLVNNYITIVNDSLVDINKLRKNINNSMRLISENKDSYEYKRRQYFIKINNEMLGKRELNLNNKINDLLVRRMGGAYTGNEDIEKMSKLDTFTSLPFLYEHDFDFNVFVKFFKSIKWNLKETLDLIELKKHSIDKYYAKVEIHLESKKIPEYVMNKVKNHYLLSEKTEVFKILHDLYVSKHYQSFVSLGAIQVEGLFYDYCTAINGGVRKNEEGTMINKVDKVFKDNIISLIYYSYFAYDVPIYRNEVAHNGISSIDKIEHLAHDILLDMSVIIDLMDAIYLPFNNVNNLLRGIKHDKKIVSFDKDYFSEIYVELYSDYSLFYRKDNEFGVYKIIKNREKHKNILSNYKTYYNYNKSDLYTELEDLYIVLLSDEFWEYILSFVENNGLSGNNVLEFNKTLTNEYIGFLDKNSKAKSYCVSIRKIIKIYESKH